MTAKEKIIQAVETKPVDTTFEEAKEPLIFLAKGERGIQPADAGEAISHTEVKERMSKRRLQDLDGSVETIDE